MKRVKDGLAFDRASVRRKDDDGHLFIETTPISKANICDYLGSEIPDADQLGLDPAKIYRLLRDPAALEAAAPSFAGKPILLQHVPISADDHPRDKVIGAIGDRVEFRAPYLMASLSIWDSEAIDLIESGKQRELSSGYRYRPIMEPGEFEGKLYDGRMVDISANHLALVEEGRAGPDVVVGDSALRLNGSFVELERNLDRQADREKETCMNKPTRLANLALRYTARGIRPLLAQDAKINLMPIFRDLTSKNFKDRKTGILTDLKSALKGKTIAQDAGLEHIKSMLDQLEKVGGEKGADESVSEEQHRAMEAAAEGNSNLGIPKDVGKEFSKADKGKSFDEGMEGLKGFLKEKGMGEDDIAKACDMMSAYRASDETPENALDDDMDDDDEAMDEEGERLNYRSAGRVSPGKRSPEEAEATRKADEEFKRREEAKKAKDKKAMDERLKDMVSKTDVKIAIDAAVAAERDNNKALNKALDDVRPIVGVLAMGFDSAEQVYRHVAKMKGVQNADTIHADALWPILSNMPKAGARAADGDVPLGMDAAASKNFNERFPGASRIGVA